MEYQKIQTIYKRDQRSNIIEGDFTYPEFKNLFYTKWDATEKIDGMNMRVIFHPETKDFEIEGKTDNAQIPSKLFAYIYKHFDKQKLIDIFCQKGDSKEITIFGEGYGKGIMSGGSYGPDMKLILFDINIDGWWMKRSFIEEVAKEFDLDVVPYLGQMTLEQAVDKAKVGFKSEVAIDPNYIAEGIVLRTPDGLLRRNGERLITKIKHCDFAKPCNGAGINK